MTDIHNIPYDESREMWAKEMLDTVNISDPEELEAHFEIRDVQERVLERRRKKRMRKTTVGWKLLVKWADGSKSWIPLKDLKESHPI